MQLWQIAVMLSKEIKFIWCRSDVCCKVSKFQTFICNSIINNCKMKPLHLAYTGSFVITNIVMQAEDAFIAKDFLRAASFYAKVVYRSPMTWAMFHLFKDILGIRYQTGRVTRVRIHSCWSSNFSCVKDQVAC